MRLLVIPAAAMLLAACASSPAADDHQSLRGPSDALPSDIRRGTVVTLRTEGYAVRGKVPAPPERTFATVVAVYEALGIPVTAMDSASLTVGNPRFTVTRRLAGERLTEYLDCGDNRGIPNAEVYTVRMDIRSTVSPDPDGSSVATVIEATARSNDGTGTQPVVCHTRARLEERIARETLVRTIQ